MSRLAFSAIDGAIGRSEASMTVRPTFGDGRKLPLAFSPVPARCRSRLMACRRGCARPEAVLVEPTDVLPTPPVRPGGVGRVSVGGVPDHREGVVVVLTGGPAEIGVELARPELGCRQAQAHVFLARALAGFDPGCADLDALGQHPEVRLVVGA